MLRTIVLSLVVVAVTGRVALAGGVAPVPLTLADAVKCAVEKNLDLRVERYTPAQQVAEYQKSLGIYDPNLQLSATYSDTTANSSFFLSPPARQASQDTLLNAAVSQLFFTGATATLGFTNNYAGGSANSLNGLPSYWQSSLAFTVSQPLLKNFGRETTEFSIESARLGTYAALEQFNATLNALVAQVRTEYFNLYSLREEREVKRVSLSLARKILAETRGRVAAGVMPAMEILNAEFGVATREQELIDAERAVQDQDDLLCRLLQIRTPGELLPVDPPSTAPYVVSEQDAVDRALFGRPELRELRRNLELLELQTRVAANQTRPDLTLSASAATIGLATTYPHTMDRLTSGEYPDWTVGLSLTIPLGNRVAENQYRKNRLQVEQALFKLRSQEQVVTNDVRSAIRALRASYKQLEVTARGRSYAEQRFTAYVRKSAVGLATNKDVLDVENDLATAKDNQIKAQVAYANAMTQLWKSTGELLEQQRIRMVEQDATKLYGKVR